MFKPFHDLLLKFPTNGANVTVLQIRLIEGNWKKQRKVRDPSKRESNVFIDYATGVHG